MAIDFSIHTATISYTSSAKPINKVIWFREDARLEKVAVGHY